MIRSRLVQRVAMCVFALLVGATALAQQGPAETPAQRDARMGWWREARFGMFIHWGLYAIPAGKWGDATGHGEWIRDSARIPVEKYDELVQQFNPVKFDAQAWADLAREAGMKYIVITSKHHDGFCLFDSQFTDFDVMSTPFKRDVLKELSAACAKDGLKMCWYHSIMDWHHPDYLPRRPWETQRSAERADFERYVAHMKNQLRELLTNYGPIGVLWFDGEWESTWNHQRGQDLDAYVRGLQPGIIINSRVDAGGGGLGTLLKGGRMLGDFGTPEQEIPATGVPGADWETCMTMNNHWGYNAADKDFKSTADLIHKLADIASKGGNFLLNVGPTAEGEIPPESVARLKEIGAWMKVNGVAIHGTTASPIDAPAWGRCTQGKPIEGGSRLYLHVFEWPKDGALAVLGLLNEPLRAYLLARPDAGALKTERVEDSLRITLPAAAPDAIDSVIVLDVAGKPDVGRAPRIAAALPIFIDALDVQITSEQENVALHYTLDGSAPTAQSPRASGPVKLDRSATVQARAFREGKPVSAVSTAEFKKVAPRAAEEVKDAQPGLAWTCYEGMWSSVPDFERLPVAKSGIATTIDIAPRTRDEFVGLRFAGYVRVPQTGVYRFHLSSDDGSRLKIGDAIVVNNDGLHGSVEESGVVALAAGLQPITIEYFNRTGGKELSVAWTGPDGERQPLPATALFHAAAAIEQKSGQLPIPTPHERQLAWQELEFTAFVHFGMNTFTDREWGDGMEDPKLFYPTQFDARQWVEAFQAAGMKQVVLSCKHHDGFCLWPSRYTEHSVKNSPWRGGKGDVVREVADACRAAGLKFGVYISPWDRHEPCYGDSPRYNEHFKNQLTELLTGYGPIHEVWFDGACGEGPNGKRQEYDWPGFIEVVRKHAPEAVIFSDAGPDIRWVGNERGYAGETCWSTLRRDEFYPGTPNYRELTEGHEDGAYWVPAECDVSIRPGWFYHAAEDGRVKSLHELLDIYYGSVGRNGVLLLNVPPDRRGLIHESDVARLKELRAVLDETFRMNLNFGALATASSTDSSKAERGAPQAVDRNLQTAWMPEPNDAAPALTVEYPGPARFDRVLLAEDIRQGQRVREFAVETWDGQTWRPLAAGTTIGARRLLRTPVTEAARVRLVIGDARAVPAIAEFGVYKSSAREE